MPLPSGTRLVSREELTLFQAQGVVHRDLWSCRACTFGTRVESWHANNRGNCPLDRIYATSRATFWWQPKPVTRRI